MAERREALDKLRGMKLDELLKLGNCIICGKKQLDGQVPLFYCVTISRGGFDQSALQRAAGFEMMMGPLAQVMGANEDLAKIIGGPHSVFVHEHCADKVHHLLELFPKSDNKSGIKVA